MRISDWSSDVCSSDLRVRRFVAVVVRGDARARIVAKVAVDVDDAGGQIFPRPVDHPIAFGDREVRPADALDLAVRQQHRAIRSEEHTSELQSLMRISYAVFCLKKKKNNKQ